MAQDDYKEGVDYEMVLMKNQPKGGTNKTRRFFTKAEKDAMKNPKAEAPKAAAPKANPKPKAKPKADKPKFSVDMAEKAIDKAASKDQPMQSSPRPKPRPVDKTPTPVNLAKPGDITTSKLNAGAGGARPAGKPAGMPGSATRTAGGARPEGKAAGMPGKKKGSDFNIPGAGAAAAIAAGAGILAAGARNNGKGGPRRDSAKGAYNPKFGSGKPGATGFQGRMKGTEVGPRGNRSGGGGAVLGQDSMFRALGGGGFGAIDDLRDQNLLTYKKGGMIKEGSAKDMREDKAMAKKRGMTMKNWEKSAADKKHDAPKKMATGGSVRGGGCATRGKGFAGTF